MGGGLLWWMIPWSFSAALDGGVSGEICGQIACCSFDG